MASRKKSRKGKGSYLSYSAENRLQKNRNRKLKKHLKLHPEDEQARQALKSAKTPRKASRGSTPTVKTVLRDASGNKLPWPSFSPRSYQR